MKVGILIDHRGLDPEAIKSLATLYDELGYHSISLYDNARTNPEYLDTWSLLPGIALKTSRARLLPLVTDNLVRHPGLIAKMAATIDILSNGRLDFGIGAGLGGPEQKMKMLDESIQVIKKLWTELPLSSFKGEYYNLDGAESLPKPIQKPHPPILIGGSSDQVLDIVAKYGEMSNFELHDSNMKSCEAILDRLKKSCEKEMREYGSVSKTVLGTCVMDGSKKESHAPLSGTTEEIVEQLSRFERLGIDQFIVRFPNGSDQGEQARKFAIVLSKL